MGQRQHLRDFRIGPWTVRPSRNEIRARGRVVNLEPLHMDALVVLAAADGEVVSRDELIERCWNGVASDEAVSTCIYALRRTLGHESERPMIVTVRKRGYRLATPVRSGAPAAGSRRLWLGLAVVAVVGMLMVLAAPPGGGPERHRQAAEGLPVSLPVTSLQGSELDPAISPDGRSVAFSWRGPDDEGFDIYIQSLAGGAPLQVTSLPGDETNPAWSPSGQTLGFVHRGNGTTGIHIAALPDQPPRRLVATRTGESPDLAWSADGRWLYFVDRREPSGPFRVFRVDTFSGEVAAVTDPPSASFGDRDFALSADGTRMALARATLPGVETLILLELATGAIRELTSPGLSVVGIDWEPGGAWLLFAAADPTAMNLWRLHLAGGRMEPLGAAYRDLFDPALLNAGRAVIAESKRYEVNVWRIDGVNSGAAPVQAIASTRWDSGPALSPNEDQLAFLSRRGGGMDLWIQDLVVGKIRRVTQLQGEALGFVTWSPEGDRLAFASLAEGHSRIMTVSLPGDAPTVLVASDADDLAPEFSPDGKTLYFGSSRSGAWQIWALDLGSGGTRQVTVDGGIAPRHGPDGRLHYSRPGDDRIWTVGAGPELTCPGLAHWGDWLPAPEGVFCRTLPGPGGQALLLHVRPGADPVVLAEVAANVQLTLGMAYSPRRDALWFAQIDREYSDLVRLELPPPDS